MSDDDGIRATNDDAASCKKSAVQMGYWRDPYIQYFIRTSDRRTPEINRGYYARVQGVHSLLKQFLELTKCNGQIVSLGAGFDTTYWNLHDEGILPKCYVEVDFQGVTTKKTYYVQNRQPLLDKLASKGGEIKFSKTDLHSPVYHIVSADLRNVSELQQKLSECGLDLSLPTAFLAECVLVYMPADASSGLLKWISDHIPQALFINYEQVNMGDRFGQVMIDNLKRRGCSLAGVEHCQSLESQKQRFLTTGWTGADALDMLSVYKFLPQLDVERIEKLEFMDEYETFNQLLEHYAISWASLDKQHIGLDRLGF